MHIDIVTRREMAVKERLCDQPSATRLCRVILL